MHLNKTDAFLDLSNAWNNMVTDWHIEGIRAFFASFIAYIFGVQNWELLFILLLAISLDTFLGMARALKLREFSSRGMGKLLYKVPLYTILLALTHIAVNTIFVNSGINLPALDVGAYMFLILREMKGSTEKLAFFDINFSAPFKALENIMSRNSNK